MEHTITQLETTIESLISKATNIAIPEIESAEITKLTDELQEINDLACLALDELATLRAEYKELSYDKNKLKEALDEKHAEINTIEEEIKNSHIKTDNMYDAQKAEICARLHKNLNLDKLQQVEDHFIGKDKSYVTH